MSKQEFLVKIKTKKNKNSKQSIYFEAIKKNSIKKYLIIVLQFISQMKRKAFIPNSVWVL